MNVEKFSPRIWEYACGKGHLSEEFIKAGYTVYSSNIVDRGYGVVLDFLKTESLPLIGADIITNPPYSRAKEFVEHALDLVDDEGKVAMFLKIQFLEGKVRRKLFDTYPPKTVYISSSRLRCAKNGDFERYKDANAVGYTWYVWVKNYTGDPIVKWIN